jgi:hypothetical protein
MSAILDCLQTAKHNACSQKVHRLKLATINYVLYITFVTSSVWSKCAKGMNFPWSNKITAFALAQWFE